MHASLIRRTVLLNFLLISFSWGATLEVHLATPEDVRSRLERGAVPAKALGCIAHRPCWYRAWSRWRILHSVTPETLSILHSKKDRSDAIRPEDYYETYKLAALYLAWLDVKSD